MSETQSTTITVRHKYTVRGYTDMLAYGLVDLMLLSSETE